MQPRHHGQQAERSLRSFARPESEKPASAASLGSIVRWSEGTLPISVHHLHSRLLRLQSKPHRAKLKLAASAVRKRRLRATCGRAPVFAPPGPGSPAQEGPAGCERGGNGGPYYVHARDDHHLSRDGLAAHRWQAGFGHRAE